VKKYTYNFEIKDLLTQFVAAFDDTVIKRFNNQRSERQKIQVRYVFAPKQRVIYDIINKAQNITLPVVTIDLTSVSYDSSRAFNKVNKIHTYLTEDKSVSMPMPTPINLTVNMSILGKYMQDVEQIITNFAPYTNPYIILAWKEPSTVENPIEIRTEVLWDENISINCPTETTYSDKFRIVADTSFTIKGWLFKGENVEDSPIYFIENNFIALDSNWNLQQPVSAIDYENFYDQFKTGADVDLYVDSFRLSGTPAIDTVYYNSEGRLIEVTTNTPVKLNKQTNINNFTIIGDNYNQTTAVLLSSDNSTLINNFTAFDTTYTGPVTGFILPTEYYTVLSNNTLNITMPELSAAGNIDIIINNPAGWTSTRTISGFYMIAE
jgi:hypothetical protein